MIEQYFSLKDKVAIITGGASGIGQEIAKFYSEKQAKVIILDRQPPKLNNFDSFYEVDVTNEKDVEHAIEQIIERDKKIDILVNSAGIVRLENAESLSLMDWQQTLDINLTAVYRLCQVVGKHFIRQRSGKIINLASQAGVIALDKHLAYCVSKAGVISLTKVLAIEWGPFNIQVNAISPTVVMTELGKQAWSGEIAEQMKQKIPMRRFAEPEEIAAAAVFLATSGADMITGENLVIDGGYTVQ
ncbi:GolD/DthD family dehydrogenase [Thorsellia anophelis]|uniref:NAD(P)-dependent dehydrogenase, short-chain alcohol dehydrogenase family n=1 Tax=Thorsellia anophelis DSM 18579 TaxID=1123402 RepID=A0A1I0ADT7_9GAMM|nr:D-threitol dehydrogenase [Thorsellia anophelis]SES92354.1 NAD(P)-dependent dehydrogenase, short-chain alcohol dehydrogenase family [Thorsellia anophelis DSM 18579]